MDLDFDRLHKIYLAEGDEGLLREKNRLLSEYINTFSIEKQKQILTFDKQIQHELRGLSNEERLKKLSSMLTENLFDLTDSMCDLAYTLKSIKKDE